MTPNKNKLDAFAASVAVHLQDGWIGRDCDLQHIAKIIDDKGHALRFRGDGTPRVEISGILVENQGVNSPRVTVSLDRAPDAVAADLKRRLLPAYFTAYTAAAEKKAAADSKAAKIAATAAELAGIDPDIKIQGPQSSELAFFRSDVTAYFSAQVYDDRVSLALRDISPEKAKAIIKLLLDK